MLVAGDNDFDIAQRRGTHPRTIANQVQSIYRKLGVHSRTQLAARLHAGGTNTDAG
jgi:DNA-binding NarL/FixJ family response regulator